MRVQEDQADVEQGMSQVEEDMGEKREGRNTQHGEKQV